MIGLHRRLRDRDENETPKEFDAALARSRKGEAPPLDALQPNVMAVTAMKLRHAGQREGQRAYLAVERGRVSHLSERDSHTTTYTGVRNA